MITMQKLIAASVALAAIASPYAAHAKGSPVIEVVTAKLRSDVTVAQMEALDHEIGTNLIAKRTGFLSRESAPGSDHSWLAIIGGRSPMRMHL